MTVDRAAWSSLSPLLDEALELDGAALTRWLEQLSGAQPVLAAQLVDMLARRARVETSDFLVQLPTLAGLDPPPDDAPTSTHYGAGDRIGQYTLGATVGHGGMGTVWRAQGDSTALRRVVAIKLLHPGFYGPDLLDRFARERDILAALEHPQIARLYDAGVTPSGHPFLVLEYVDGVPLDAYCDDRRLPVRDRIAIFRQVLGAVAFAHSHLVIHRDLKPTNVLVTADGSVRLLDFGVAKLLPAADSVRSDDTQVSQCAMTPRYAAPEQLSAATVTTATDVYALGVILYELVSGASPYRPARDSRGALEDAILEADPSPPSQDVTHAAAERRTASRSRLRGQLRGDLDTIILKSLKKLPGDRYATVLALDEDLVRYLEGSPVVARPDTITYRARKFVGRHRVEVAAAVALLASLAVAVVTLEAQLHRTTRERDRADRLTAFMTRLFQVANPAEETSGRVSARDLLDKASADIETGLGRDPEERARLTLSMARSYTNLGAFGRAEELLRREQTRAASDLGGSNRLTLQLGDALLWEMYAARELAAAIPFGEDLVGRMRLALGADDRDTATAEEHLAHILGASGRYPKAAALADHAVSVLYRTAGPDDIDRLESEADAAFFRFRAGSGAVDDGDRRLRRVLAQVRVQLGSGNARTISAANRLSVVLAKEGKFEEDVAVLRAAIADGKAALGTEPYVIADSLDNLAAALLHVGNLAEAETVVRESLELNVRLHGAGTPRTALAEYNLACVVARLGRKDEAVGLLESAIAHGLIPDAAQHMDSDEDLASLTSLPRFEALVAKVRANSAPPAPAATGPLPKGAIGSQSESGHR